MRCCRRTRGRSSNCAGACWICSSSWGYEYVVAAADRISGRTAGGLRQRSRIADVPNGGSAQRPHARNPRGHDVASRSHRCVESAQRRHAATLLCRHGRACQSDRRAQSRVPFIAGAELFGAAAIEADAEVVSLMVETLHCAGIDAPVIELGHVGIFRALAAAARIRSLARAGGVRCVATQGAAGSGRVARRTAATAADPRGDSGAAESARGAPT